MGSSAVIVPLNLAVQKSPISALNGMRGISAVLIALFHLSYYFVVIEPVPGAYMLVDLFFVISGFVSSMHYEASLALGKLTLSQFLLRRLKRLYPVLALCLIMTFVTNAVIVLLLDGTGLFPVDRLWWDFFLQASMLQGISNMAIPWVWPTWAVSIEWLTSIIFALTVLATRRRAGIPNRALWACLILNVLYLVNASPQTLNLGVASPFYNPMLARGVLSFTAGLLAFHYHTRLPPLRRRYLNITAVLLIALALYRLLTLDAGWMDYYFALLIWPMLMLQCLYPGSLMGRFFSLRVFTWVGQISYSIFLLHVPVSYILNVGLPHMGLPQWGNGLALVLSVGLVSWASYRFLETPLRQPAKQ